MCFPTDHHGDSAFQRSSSGLVRSRTDLVSPPSIMTQPPAFSLSSRGPLFIMSQKASHTPVTVARPGESQNPAVAEPPTVTLVNEHVQSTHCVSLKPDYINQDLNFKGQVPLSDGMGGKHGAVKVKDLTLHITLPTLIHLTPHFCWRTTQRNISPRPHSRSRKADKRPRKTSHWVLA